MHLLVAIIVVVMVNLGFWQLSRLDDKRSANAVIEARADLAPVALASLRGSADLSPTDHEWRPVTVRGTYEGSRAVTVLNRSAEGIAGTHSVVPFRADDGRVIFVNRGFVPLAATTPAAPDGQMTIVGYLKRSEKRGTLGAVDSTDTATVEFHRLDIPLIANAVTEADTDVETMFLLLAKESPETPSQWPARIPLPPLDEGSHLSYAGQWFLFSVVAIGGWMVIIGRAVRTSRRETAVAVNSPS